MRVIIKILLIAGIAFLNARFLPGVEAEDTQTMLIVAVALALINAIARPLIKALTYSFTLLSIVIFLLAVNALAVKLASHFIDGFSVPKWITAVVFGFIITVASIAFDRYFKSRQP